MSVKAENVRLHYGKQEVLKDITFELNENKIYGLLGRNGAGKTSLLSIIASFREQSSGSITINGEIPFENAEIMQQVALMYNKDYKDESDNADSILKNYGRYRPNFDLEYAHYLIRQFKLDKKRPIKKFSKGMQSAFNVIMGLASRTPVTIFDEVYLGMDAPARDIFYKELLKDQENHPRIIILSTHLVSEMDYLFDEVILLHKGEMLLQEDYNSLVSRGASVTGNAETVDKFVREKKKLNEQQLGNTKSVMIYEELSNREYEAGIDQGLEIGPISLQDLFIHLTKEEDGSEAKSNFS